MATDTSETDTYRLPKERISAVQKAVDGIEYLVGATISAEVIIPIVLEIQQGITHLLKELEELSDIQSAEQPPEEPKVQT